MCGDALKCSSGIFYPSFSRSFVHDFGKWEEIQDWKTLPALLTRLRPAKLKEFAADISGFAVSHQPEIGEIGGIREEDGRRDLG